MHYDLTAAAASLPLPLSLIIHQTVMSNKAASETLDTTNAVRPVWLVKVPRFVTQGWAAAAENGNDGTAVVGRVRMEVDPSLLSADNPNPKAEVTIHLNDAATAAATSTAASAVPEQLVLAPQGESDDTGTLHVMCRRDTAMPPTSCIRHTSHLRVLSSWPRKVSLARLGWGLT